MDIYKPILCKYCMREIVHVNGVWLTNNPNIVFPQYCGFPWTPEQKHEPKKEELNGSQ